MIEDGVTVMVDNARTQPVNAVFLKTRMSELGLTKEQVADRTQHCSSGKRRITERTIQRWRNGTDSKIAESHRQLLALALECHPDALVSTTDTDERKKLAHFFSSTSTAIDLFAWGNFEASTNILKFIMLSIGSFAQGVMHRVWSVYAFIQLMAGNLAESEKYTKKILEQAHDEKLKKRGLCVTGLCHIYRGNFKASSTAFQEAIDCSTSRKEVICNGEQPCEAYDPFEGDRFLHPIAETGLGTALMYQGDLQNARLFLERSLAALQTGTSKIERIMTVMTYFNYVCVLIELRCFDTAQSGIQKALALAENTAYRRGKQMLLLTKAWLRAEKGQWDEACELCECALSNYPKKDPGFIHWEIAARVYRLAGNYTRLEITVQLAKKACKFSHCLGGVFHEIGLYHFNRRESVKAHEWLHASLTHFESTCAHFRAKQVSALLAICRGRPFQDATNMTTISSAHI